MEPFIGEIRINAFSFAPQGWALCNGQTLPINQNQALFALLGNKYGATSTTFNLPDLRGRTPVSYGTGDFGRSYPIGQAGGSEGVALTPDQLPAHTHQATAIAATSTKPTPAGNFLGQGLTTYVANPAGNKLVALNGATVGEAGASAAHNNIQPTLVLSFCIALNGTFPPRQ